MAEIKDCCSCIYATRSTFTEPCVSCGVDFRNYVEKPKPKRKRKTKIDLRQVVLCKDCRHRDPEDHKCDCGQPERQGCLFSVRDNYWCACGERRKES